MCTVCEKEGKSGPASATQTPTKPAHLSDSLMELGVGTLPRGDDGLAQTHRILPREMFRWLLPAQSEVIYPCLQSINLFSTNMSQR